jgi:beta-galactosidase
MLAEQNPNMIMYGSESYALDAFDAWAAVEKYPYVMGDFVWTAIEYIGEASLGWHGFPEKKELYPWTLSFDGDIDVCGWKRPQSYYRDAFWNKDNITIVVHPPIPSFESPQTDREDWSRWHFDDVVFDWNWAGMEGKPVTVDIYSSSKEVELFLNGKSMGRKMAGRENKNKATYTVPYEKGELKAIGYNENGKTIENILKTSDAASMIKLTTDRTCIKVGGQDLCYVTIELLDQNGILDPKAENQLDFSITGDATIIAVGNANPKSVESYTLPTRKAWRGKCLVVVKSGQTTGDVTLTVKSPGLKDASVKLIIGF